MAEVLQAGESPVPGPESRMQYDAFLSYAHRDKDVTSAIQKGLHQIGRRVGQLRALRVFRDDTNLTANPDLWGKITEALQDSRFMIVVLSPQSAASHWVNEEVKHWLDQRGHEGLMLVLAEGRLAWDAERGRFDPEQSTAAPPVLTQLGSLPAEPLYIDVSGDAPWELGSLAFRDKVTSLAAPIHGKPKDDLTGDDLREQRRSRRLRRAAIAGLAVLTVLAVVAASVAIVQWGKAIREARDALAAQLDTEAAAVFSGVTGDSDIQALADTLAAQRLRSDPAASRGAFYTATTALNTTRIIVPTPAPVHGVALSPDGHTLASGSFDHTVRVWDLTDPAHPAPLGGPLTGHTNVVLSVAFSPDGHTLASGVALVALMIVSATFRYVLTCNVAVVVLTSGRQVAGPRLTQPVVAVDGVPLADGVTDADVVSLSVAGSGGEAMDSADGLIEAAEATGNPSWLALALTAYGLAFRDADPVGALNALGRGLVIAQDNGYRAQASVLANGLV